MDMITLAMAKKYTDSQRLAYVADAEVIVDEALLADTGGELGGSYCAKEGVNGNELTVGKTYTVKTDSGSFTAVCKELDGFPCLGNGSNFGGEDTGESYLVWLFKESGWVFLGIDYNKGSHMKVVTNETIHPIDPKFLPEGYGAPVCDIFEFTLNDDYIDGAVGRFDANSLDLTKISSLSDWSFSTLYERVKAKETGGTVMMRIMSKYSVFEDAYCEIASYCSDMILVRFGVNYDGSYVDLSLVFTANNNIYIVCERKTTLS